MTISIYYHLLPEKFLLHINFCIFCYHAIDLFFKLRQVGKLLLICRLYRRQVKVLVKQRLQVVLCCERNFMQLNLLDMGICALFQVFELVNVELLKWYELDVTDPLKRLH